MAKIYNKLVRDKILEIIEADDLKPVSRILKDDEYKQELIKKLGEEYQEFCDDPSVEELADIMEVLKALTPLITTAEELERVQTEKATKRGAFENKIFLERVEE